MLDIVTKPISAPFFAVSLKISNSSLAWPLWTWTDIIELQEIISHWYVIKYFSSITHTPQFTIHTQQWSLTKWSDSISRSYNPIMGLFPHAQIINCRAGPQNWWQNEAIKFGHIRQSLLVLNNGFLRETIPHSIWSKQPTWFRKLSKISFEYLFKPIWGRFNKLGWCKWVPLLASDYEVCVELNDHSWGSAGSE